MVSLGVLAFVFKLFKLWICVGCESFLAMSSSKKHYEGNALILRNVRIEGLVFLLRHSLLSNIDNICCIIWRLVEKNDEHRGGFESDLVMAVKLKGENCWCLEEPWDFCDIFEVGDWDCFHFFVQLLKIELWEWKDFWDYQLRVKIAIT
jgi:hypothetical protein